MINQHRTGIRLDLYSSFEHLIYTDDLALPSYPRDQVLRKTKNLEQQASSIGLTVNAKKTKVLTNSTLTEQPIVINDHRLEYVNKLTYLGSIISVQRGAEQDIKTRLGKARSACANLQLLLEILSILPKRPNSESTRAMSSLCSSTAQSAGA